MISFPHCKINLGLSIINKRNDGYHNLETIFYPVAVKDILEIIPDSETAIVSADEADSRVQFTTSGLSVDGNTADNLCVKAYRLLKKDFGRLGSIKMHLHKAIPMGAGLGGGSADGAYVLKSLNTLFELGLSPTALIRYAALLGSDCPFFIVDAPCYATGRGEIMEPLALDLSSYKIVLVNAGITINTGWAFSQLDLANRVPNPDTTVKAVIQQPVSKWQQLLMNDFETPVFKNYPEIRSIKETLYAAGAVYASMTGSGSTVYGLFEKSAVLDLKFPENYWLMKLNA